MHKLSRFIAPDSKINIFLGKVSDIVILNLLWLLCSLPIITIGTATTAIYAVFLKDASGKGIYAFKDYCRAFKQHFWRATFIWLAFAAVMALLGFDLLLIQQMPALSQAVLIFPLVTLSVLTLAIGCFLFPTLAYFHLSAKQTCKAAFKWTFVSFPTTFAVVFLSLAPIPVTLFIWGLGLPVISTYLYLLGTTAFFVACSARLLVKLYSRVRFNQAE
ncbi:MAG: DUF624 domain-containing protein [Sporolactobacillus sp.]|jgi:uncharacterized membrane protein YesL|nr:DUF624 domain-containing protein [Sporolactobacillus sp.]